MGRPLGKLIILLNLVGEFIRFKLISALFLIAETRRYLKIEALNTIQFIVFVDE